MIVPGSYWLTSYDPKNGEENWRFSGTARFAISSPAASDDLFFSINSNFSIGDSGEKNTPPASSIAAFTDLDQLTRIEPARTESALLAIRAGGCGNITETHLAWKSTRGLPFALSPLFYKGRLYTIKLGGFVSAYDVKTGQPIYQDERINASGDHYASPVAAADRIYFVSEHGTVTVLKASANTPTILSQNKLEEQTMATPALVDQTILIRTTTNLFSFGIRR